MLPGAEEKLSANAYLGLTALAGAIGWIPTVFFVHVKHPPPSGVVGIAEVGPWIAAVTQHSWELMGIWAAITVVLLAIGVLRAERGVLLSIPQLVWTAGILISLVCNAVGVLEQIAVLVWGPWFALFAVGYLLTGLVVQRGGVYLASGLVSLLLAGYSLYAFLTSSGTLVIDPTAGVPVAGAVLLPVPYTYVVLGLLHVVPVALDAARGGRQMTDAGIPAVKEEALGGGEDDVGGIVPD